MRPVFLVQAEPGPNYVEVPTRPKTDSKLQHISYYTNLILFFSLFLTTLQEQIIQAFNQRRTRHRRAMYIIKVYRLDDIGQCLNIENSER